MVQGSQKKKKTPNPWTVFNNSQDFCSQVYWYLLHADSTCAGVHIPCSLRVAGLLPTSSTTCVTSFCGCWALLLHWVVWSHLHTDRSPISSASPSCTSLPSPSPRVTAPGKKKAIWSYPVLPFPPGRPESLIWPFFIVCCELAVASSNQGALLLEDHYLFSSCSTSLCMLRNVGREQHKWLEMLLCFWWSLT